MGGKIILAKKPKVNLEETFYKDKEKEQFKFLLYRNERVIILYLRLSEKTSLAIAVSNTLHRKVIYEDLVKVKGIRDMIKRVYSAVPKSFIIA